MSFGEFRLEAELQLIGKAEDQDLLPWPVRAEQPSHGRLRLSISSSVLTPPQFDEVNKDVQRCAYGRSDCNEHGHLPG
jgi:hypothetical protein